MSDENNKQLQDDNGLSNLKDRVEWLSTQARMHEHLLHDAHEQIEFQERRIKAMENIISAALLLTGVVIIAVTIKDVMEDVRSLRG